MDLDRLKAVRRKERASEYLFEKPPNQVAADIRKKAEKMERKYFRQTIALILLSIIGIASFSLLCRNDQSILANIGAILICIGAFLEAMTCLTLYFPFQEKRYELCRREFLARERALILARIRVWRGNTGWYVLPMALGGLLWAVARAYSIGQSVAVISLLALTLMANTWIGRRRIDRDLRPVLDDIDRELEELDLTPV